MSRHDDKSTRARTWRDAVLAAVLLIVLVTLLVVIMQMLPDAQHSPAAPSSQTSPPPSLFSHSSASGNPASAPHVSVTHLIPFDGRVAVRHAARRSFDIRRNWYHHHRPLERATAAL